MCTCRFMMHQNLRVNYEFWMTWEKRWVLIETHTILRYVRVGVFQDNHCIDEYPWDMFDLIVIWCAFLINYESLSRYEIKFWDIVWSKSHINYMNVFYKSSIVTCVSFEVNMWRWNPRCYQGFCDSIAFNKWTHLHVAHHSSIHVRFKGIDHYEIFDPIFFSFGYKKLHVPSIATNQYEQN